MCTIRKLDPLGRIVIPKDLRDFLKISKNQELVICLDNDQQAIKITKLSEHFITPLNNSPE